MIEYEKILLTQEDWSQGLRTVCLIKFCHYQNSSGTTSGVGIFLGCDIYKDTSALHRL